MDIYDLDILNQHLVGVDREVAVGYSVFLCSKIWKKYPKFLT